MTTRFNSILKIKKDILNKIERELIKINQAISLKENEIMLLKEQLNNMKAPNVSVYRELLAFKDSTSAFLNEIIEEQNLLEMMYSSRIDINKRYKIAMIEYEKINYLHTEELKLKIDKLKKEEQKFIDEVGGILYHLKK
ncbi:flagellar export protein FliJ [Helicobacter sp. MIT 99-5507]|uniref:flagellar export protein FliJ n=1 Tax=Helicobacter sp. MIT 99-5507 TaxID=152489 RepID=UPI000E1E3068|nr:flagellar export protein FliJ [Helicobacter sp. MIT 99-5507]RDU57871.1 hypothetical protein CQA42_02925 [Helicobacter sp. MIT 99-5507]